MSETTMIHFIGAFCDTHSTVPMKTAKMNGIIDICDFLKLDSQFELKLEFKIKRDRLHMNLDFIRQMLVDYTFTKPPTFHERYFLMIQSINTFALSSDYTTMLPYHNID